MRACLAATEVFAVHAYVMTALPEPPEGPGVSHAAVLAVVQLVADVVKEKLELPADGATVAAEPDKLSP